MRWLSAVRWRSIAANIYRGGRAAGDDLVSAWAGRARRLQALCSDSARCAGAGQFDAGRAGDRWGVHCGGCAAASADRLQPRRPPMLRAVGLHS
ncbi:hypothetical protein XEUV181_15410 [Xanthomonas euvesicatoria]|nr:hypothetical protein XEUV181_15410 [Xanthomonas euvesicatoria]KLB33854.1 hypothetical protein XEUV199_14275 [Xanthomonas euvesicatoria]